MTIDLFTGVMTGLLNCADEALTAHERPVGWKGLVHGTEEVWDDCCDGMLFVRLAQVYPTAGPNAAFPGQDTQHRNCGINMLSATLEVGVMRCAESMDNSGNPPSAVTITAETAGVTYDASVLLEAIMCCLPGLAGVQASMINVWNPRPTLGGCVGGAWQVRVAVGHCGCP